MKSSRKDGCWQKFLLRRAAGTIAGTRVFALAGVGLLACGIAARAQTALPMPVPDEQAAPPATTGTAASTAVQASSQLPVGSISGTVDTTVGGPVQEAVVTLVENGRTVQQVQTADNGQYSFPGIAPGIYQLTISAPDFQTKTISVALQPGQTYMAPKVVLALAPVITTVKVTPPRAEVAQYQLSQEEKQLVLGFIPNYLVTYYPHTAPLTAKQKFQLTFKTVFNPFTLGLTTAFVGGEQMAGMYSGYGNEEKSFVKRFGAAYATLGVGAFVGDALLPSILHQDPRFYYKADGSFQSKFFYAITRSFICKGDNGHWEPDFSAVLGHFAAGGIANLYLPKQNRSDWNTTLENGLIGIGFDAFANILQEFVLPKFTPALSHRRFGRP